MEEDVQSIIDALPAGYQGWSLTSLQEYLLTHFNASSNITHEVLDSIRQTATRGNIGNDTDDVIKDVFFSLLAAISGQDLRKLTESDTTDTVTNTTATTTDCNADNSAEFFQNWFLYSLIPSMVLIIVFSFLQKRKKACLDCCHGYLGVAYPMNIIDSSPDRLSYACAFGVTTVSVLGLYFHNYILDYDLSAMDVMLKGILNIFIKTANVLCVVVVYYPIFLSLSTKITVVGNITGLLYSLSWLTFNFYDVIRCSAKETDKELISTLLFDIPNIICYGILVIRFLVGIVRDIRDFCVKGIQKFVVKGEDFRDSHHYLYVKSLLYQRRTTITESSCQSKFQKIRKLLYKNKPGFRYSNGIICTLTVAGLVLLQFSTSWNLFVMAFMKSIKDYLKDDKIALAFQIANHSSLYDSLIEFIDVNMVTFNFAHVVSVIIHYLLLLLLLVSYRGHMLKLFQGDKSSFQGIDLTNSNAMAYSWKFGGYQVAYILWSWIVMQVVMWICCFVISYLVILPLRDNENSIVLFCLESYWLLIILGILLAYIQVFLAKFIFLQERGAVLGANNRRWASVIYFILFYYNIIVGWFSCLIRLFYSALFGLIYLGRTDNSILMRRYESKDPGLKAYYGFLLTEEYHSHPVLVTFCNFLLEFVDDQHSGNYRTNLYRGTFRYTQKDVEENVEKDTNLNIKPGKVLPAAKRKCIRNKWRLIVTLLHNPSLVKYRSNSLLDGRNEDIKTKPSKQPGLENRMNKDNINAYVKSSKLPELEVIEEETQVDIRDVRTWILKDKHEINMQDDIWDDIDNAAIATMFADSTHSPVVTLGTDNPEASFSDV